MPVQALDPRWDFSFNMPRSDAVLAELIAASRERAGRPTGLEEFSRALPTAILNAAALIQQQRQQELEFGRPGRGFGPAVSVGVPPADPRRRILGIPIGRLPAFQQVTPMVAGAGGTAGVGAPVSDIPIELLTPDVQAAVAGGQPVFYRPASRGFRPAELGMKELGVRRELLRAGVQPQDPERFLLEADRRKAFEGVGFSGGTGRMRIRLPVDDTFREVIHKKVYKYALPKETKDVPEAFFNATMAAYERRTRMESDPRYILYMDRLARVGKTEAEKELKVVRDELADRLNAGTMEYEPERIEALQIKAQALVDKIANLEASSERPALPDQSVSDEVKAAEERLRRAGRLGGKK